MMRARHRSVLGLVSASALAALSAPFVVAPAQAADSSSPVVENVVNAELLPETEEGPPPGWSWLGWDTTGGTGVARVEVDDSEPVHHDGSLHVATPAAGDAVRVRQVVPLNRTDGPSLQGTTSIGFDVRAVAGPAPDLIIKVDCNARASSSPEAAFTLTYAGAVPSDGGWHHVDASDSGAAMWWSDATMNADGTAADPSQLPTAGGLKGGAGSPHPMSEFTRVCTDSLIRSYGVRQAIQGADGYVDNVRLAGRSTNFWVPVLTRLAGENRRVTACEAARHQFTNFLEYSQGNWWNPAAVRDHPKAVVVVNQNSYADALAAGPLANAVHGALLLNPGRGETGCMSVPGIERVDTVYLVGGTGVLDATVEGAFRELGITTINRIGGDDRYETAVKVTQAIDAIRPAGTTQQVFLASGTDFPDALSAGAPAGHAFGSVLLTKGASAAPATSAYLAGRPDATVYAIGGPAAEAATLPAANELVGANRYETATIVADRFFPNPTSAAFASGVGFADALAAAAYGGHLGAPVILVGPDAVPNAVFSYAARHRSTLRGSVLLGGTGAVNRLAFDLLSTKLTPAL
jgi:putative cell wall-binding protein